MMLAEMADPISGGGGWLGAGLLGLVLAWLLLRHLPSKDAQIERLVESRDAMVRAVVAEHRATVERVVGHCEEEIRAQRELSEARHLAMVAALADLTVEMRSRKP